VRVYKLKAFARFQRRQGIADEALAKAVQDAERGILDADLGRGLIKQCVARLGEGKRGGYRTVLAYRQAERAVFLYGFAKSTRANVDDDELEALRRRGERLLGAVQEALDVMIADDELLEVPYDEED
jgi:hypothetical protein